VCNFFQDVEKDHGKVRINFILLTYSGAIFQFFISVDTYMITIAYPSYYNVTFYGGHDSLCLVTRLNATDIGGVLGYM
jgi:hypothetical protein